MSNELRDKLAEEFIKDCGLTVGTETFDIMLQAKDMRNKTIKEK